MEAGQVMSSPARRRPAPSWCLTWCAFALFAMGQAGCGGRPYIVFDSPTDPLDYSATARIGRIQDRVPEEDFDKHPTVEATQALREALADRLEREGIFERVATHSEATGPADYEISGRVLSYDPPKEAPVFLQILYVFVYGPWDIPRGDGGHLWVNLTLRDQPSGRILYSGNFLGRDGNPVKAVAKDFVKELKNRPKP